MAEFARLVGEAPDRHEALAEQARAGFARFWNEEAGHCYDVLDGPGGSDPALRPNQFLALSPLHSPLTAEQQKVVVDACARRLLTSHGLCSLDPRHPGYTGHHGGDRCTRDAAYHQGTVWGWLIGPFVSAHLRVYPDPALARSFLGPLIQELDAHCVGSLTVVKCRARSPRAEGEAMQRDLTRGATPHPTGLHRAGVDGGGDAESVERDRKLSSFS